MVEPDRIPLPKRAKDETGNVYGRLTVLYPVAVEHQLIWLCRCECGTLLRVKGVMLRCGNTKSCGCSKIRHGQCRRGRLTPEYRCWKDMNTRCYRSTCKHYKNYGGRGIQVCEQWRESFETFFADIGARPSDRHSIDRIDNDGNYEPDNCRWSEKREQDSNRRTNRLITHNGVTKTMTEWGRVLGVHPVTIHLRLKKGWPLERALS